MPTAESDWLFFQGEPLAEDTRMTGAARLELSLTVDRDHAHLDAGARGRGARRHHEDRVARLPQPAQYRDGLASGQPIPPASRSARR